MPVLVFTRTPVPGRVKTRLIPAIGAERAVNLHRAMLWRTVSTAVESGVGPVELWCTPDTDHPCLADLRRQFGVGLYLQSGEDLGERMHRALQSRLDSHGGALLVGTDCPFLEADDLLTAAGVLRDGADAVIGPAEDGGYYLIGVRRSVAAIYAGVPWGSERVLARSRENLRDLGWSWHELVARPDVDRPEDLPAVEELLIY
jgi:rSAM/selenodomain-associated transferase 1